MHNKYPSTKPAFRNIASKCHVQPGRLHNLDTVSIQMRVDANTELMAYNFTSLPKMTAAMVSYLVASILHEVNIILAAYLLRSLVIINPIQREWLRKYGKRAVCMDDTFNLTSYALRLATVIVADEWDRALPAAYLLSYRSVFNLYIYLPCLHKILG